MNPVKKDYFLFLGPGAPEKVYWAERPAYGEVVLGQGPLSEALHLQGEEVVVLVPGSEVLLTEVVIPGARGRIIKKSIPYALEDDLAEDIDNLHFAHGPISRSGETSVLVVAKTRMESWLAMLNENGIEAQHIVPTTMAIPLTPEQWTVVLADGQFMLRKDPWHAYVGDIDSLSVYLEGEMTAVPDQKPTIQLYTNGDDPIDFEEAVGGMTIAASHKKPLLQLLADGYDGKQAINLLQGDYGIHAGWRDMWTKWQMVLIPVLLLLSLNIIGFSFDYYSVRAKNSELSDRMKSIYLQSFPESRRVVNAKAQMAQKLAELQKNTGMQSDFFEIYDKTIPLLMKTSGFSLDNLRFNNGRFNFDFAIKDLQSLEKLKHNLANIPGLAIDIKHAEVSGSLVKAKIQIKSRQ